MFVIVFFMLLLNFSCSQTQYEIAMKHTLQKKNADKNPKPIFEGVLEPSFPDFDKNDSDFMGVDSNFDGIRDDVEIWINRTGKDFNERMAMKIYARQVSEMYKDITKFKKESSTMFLCPQKQILIDAINRADRCMDVIFFAKIDVSTHITNKIDALMQNTSVRRERYREYMYESCSFSSEYSRNEDLKYCDFTVENPDLIIKRNKVLMEK